MDVQPLQAVSALAQVAAEDRQRIAAAAVQREFAAGAQIVAQGTLTDEFFMLLKGTVDIAVDGSVVAQRTAGEFFGEVGALSPGPGYALARTASVCAHDEVSVAVVDGEEFSALLATIPAFRDAVYAELDRWQTAG